MAVIDFACKQVPIEQIIRCAFALSKTDYLIFKLISSKNEITVHYIGEKIKKDRTTVQRSIKSLVSKKLIHRRQVNLASGGFLYYYSVTDKEPIKEKIYENFNQWQKKVLDELEKW